MERFSTGAVLSTGLRMFARTVFRLFPVLLVVHAPLIFLHVQAHLAEPGLDQAIAAIRANEWNWLVLPLEIPMAAIVTHWVVKDLRGARVSVLTSVAAGLRRTLHALGVMILVYLVFFALSFAVAVPVGAAARLDDTGVLALLSVLGMIGLTFAIYSRWFVVIPAVVIERPGPADALTRSGELTEGRRLRITAVIIVMCVAFGAVLFGLLAAVGSDYYSDDLGFRFGTAGLTPWLASLNVTLFVLFGVLRAVMSATAYYLIRTETEAQSPEQLAKVFD